MGDFTGATITKLNGGLGRRDPSTDSIFALICAGVAATGLALNTVARFIQITDAEDMGINPAFDANNDILVHHHIAEYFRLNPDGTLLFMMVAQATSMAAMCDKANDNLKKIIMSDEANREVRYCGVVLNPLSAYTPTITNGVDVDVTNAIAKAQELIDDLAAQKIFIDGVMIEGRNISTTIATLKDLTTLGSENVSVVIAQDPAIVALDAIYTHYAAVGSALGMLSVRHVDECMGSIVIETLPRAKKGQENYPLGDVPSGKWLKSQIGGSKSANSLTLVERNLLDAKGYIWAGSYEGYEGIFFSGSATCTANSDDYSRIEKNRVWNKAVRYLNKAVIPRFNSKVQFNADGTIKATDLQAIQNAAEQQVGNMLTANEISQRTIYINPAQNILGGDPLNIKLTIVPNGIIEEITEDIGFENPLNQ